MPGGSTDLSTFSTSTWKNTLAGLALVVLSHDLPQVEFGPQSMGPSQTAGRHHYSLAHVILHQMLHD